MEYTDSIKQTDTERAASRMGVVTHSFFILLFKLIGFSSGCPVIGLGATTL